MVNNWSGNHPHIETTFPSPVVFLGPWKLRYGICQFLRFHKIYFLLRQKTSFNSFFALSKVWNPERGKLPSSRERGHCRRESNPPAPPSSLLVEASRSQAVLQALELTPIMLHSSQPRIHTMQAEGFLMHWHNLVNITYFFLSFQPSSSYPFVPILLWLLHPAQLSLNFHRDSCLKKIQVLSPPRRICILTGNS